MADPAASGESGAYVFKPHERPFMPGSPASPDHPAPRKFGYLLIGLYLAIIAGFQNGLLIANLTVLPGHLDLTPVDRKSTRLNSSHYCACRMPSSACKKKTTEYINTTKHSNI